METICSSEKLVNFDCTAWQHVEKTVFIRNTNMRILNIARQRSPSLAKLSVSLKVHGISLLINTVSMKAI
jgi:hypothetical protein